MANKEDLHTAPAIAKQPFKSFDIKLPSGVRFSFERRGDEFKVLEGEPGKSRIYRMTFEPTVSRGRVRMKVTQQEGEFIYPAQWSLARDIFWLAYKADCFN